MGPNHKVDQLVLYDGVCRFCNNSVNFILSHEKGAKLFFAPLQSTLGQSILKENGLPPDYNDSLLFVSREQIYSHADAALRLAGYLKFPWSLLSIFRILPSFLTNPGYNLVAKHRYLLMGKSEVCIVPTPKNKYRFLE